MSEERLHNFEDSRVWKDAVELAAKVYSLTKTFPNDEKFGITNQIRRAVASISANIAEGFGRKGRKDTLHFYTIAYGSLLETKSFLYLAQKLNYVEDISELLDICVDIQKQINAIKSAIGNHD